MAIAFKKMETPDPNTLKAHPLADLFPMMEGEAFTDLVHDIKEHGLREPIVLLDDEVLDGRNRLKACREGGVEPRFAEFHGSDPAAFVISLNLKRRHLSESQRSMVAAKLAKLPVGANQHTGSENLPTQSNAATMLNVSDRSIRSAKQVQKRGVPELSKAVEDGEVSVSAASVIAKQPADKQIEIISAKDQKRLNKAASELRAAQKFAAEVEAMPDAEPMSEDDKEALAEAVGTEAQRSLVWEIRNIAKTVAEFPAPEEAVSTIPPAFEPSTREEMPSLEGVSKWFDAFVSAWKAKEKTIDAAE
ncbi:hypothetical protein [Filomicrobium sp.]|uniref:hypothetical protein n=1 Tax=Filomicrobium sp. TaxID=2024831 RepID=UPI0025860295|nr:hypothetical protein [Filomicrobium sp.]MCV0371685.1 hypothetical protein [Filomicrobium sp.]